jgi:putative ABC transport system substrate-binding protein
MACAWLRSLALWWCLCFGASGVWAATAVAIVSADQGGVYMEAAEAVLDQLRRQGVAATEVVRLTAAELDSSDVLVRNPPRLVITLGTEALGRVLGKGYRGATIAGLIPRTSYERLVKEAGKSAPAAVSAVFLDQPFGRQMDLIRLALPDAQRVGVLWGAESESQQPVLQVAVNSRGMELKSDTVVAGGLFSGLKDLLGNVDVLLAVADTQVYNGTTLPNILLATYRARIPVVAFSPSYVKAGALIALYSTPTQVGNQVGAMARATLLGLPLAAPQLSQDYTISVNDYVARSLGLTLDVKALTEQLRRMDKRP